jgi:RHS repeat-associated protein
MTQRTEGGPSTGSGQATYTQNFDAENRLTSVISHQSSVVTSFKYNGDGNLVAKLVGDVATYYIGGIYEVEVTNTTITKKTYYYPAGGAIRVEDFVNSANSGVFYILKDHLGSASVTLDSSGNSIAESRYYPFGETRVTSGTIPTDKRFQSQRDVGLGLMHFGARFYSVKLGRFISADTIVPQPFNPQSLNRYSFVINNPLRFTDPTGHSYCDSAMADPTECPGGSGVISCVCNTPTNTGYSGGGLEPAEVIFISSGGTSGGGTILGGGGCNDPSCTLPSTWVSGGPNLPTCNDCEGWGEPYETPCNDCEGWGEPYETPCYDCAGWGVPDFGPKCIDCTGWPERDTGPKIICSSILFTEVCTWGPSDTGPKIIANSDKPPVGQLGDELENEFGKKPSMVWWCIWMGYRPK